MTILGIESSCDETAAAVVSSAPRSGALRLRSSVVSSQVAEHAPYGGVVPEIASRSHIRFITEVIAAALARAKVSLARIDAVAATAGPGLPGALLVGLTAGKAMAYLLKRPFIAVNHIEAHVCSGFLAEADLNPPLLALVASGGHTDLIHLPRHGEYRILGRTRDDAAGEAYDKAAKLLGLGYPGGPKLERLARTATSSSRFPVAKIMDGGLDFSFSGLKTAVAMAVERADGTPKPALAAGFQDAVIAALVGRTTRALDRTKAKRLVLAGGVAANAAIRNRFAVLAKERRIRLVVPPMALCTDNAGMIAAAGWFAAKRKAFSPLTVPARADWKAGTAIEAVA